MAENVQAKLAEKMNVNDDGGDMVDPNPESVGQKGSPDTRSDSSTNAPDDRVQQPDGHVECPRSSNDDGGDMVDNNPEKVVQKCSPDTRSDSSTTAPDDRVQQLDSRVECPRSGNGGCPKFSMWLVMITIAIVIATSVHTRNTSHVVTQPICGDKGMKLMIGSVNERDTMGRFQHNIAVDRVARVNVITIDCLAKDRGIQSWIPQEYMHEYTKLCTRFSIVDSNPRCTAL